MANVTEPKPEETTSVGSTSSPLSPRLPYATPQLVRLGGVFELTMKSGSDNDFPQVTKPPV